MSANRPIPGLVPDERAANADTRVWFDAVSPAVPSSRRQEIRYRSTFIESGRPALRVWELAGGGHFRLRYSDGTEFVVDRAGRDIWARWADSSTLEDAATYLLGPILGFVLRLQGITCLHASAVAVGDRAIALVGPASAGKSTTAAAFSRLGYPVLADDVVALHGREATVHVQPAYPQLRLWPESVAFLYGSADALPRLTPNWDKRSLDLNANGHRFERRPLPLAAVYVLEARSTDAAAPLVERIRGQDALLTLIANTYANYLMDADMLGRDFRVLGQLVATVPVRRVVPSAEPARLPQLCRRILDDLEARR
jgi:hypothetical protein